VVAVNTPSQHELGTAPTPEPGAAGIVVGAVLEPDDVAVALGAGVGELAAEAAGVALFRFVIGGAPLCPPPHEASVTATVKPRSTARTMTPMGIPLAISAT
jgi:hypothetical protein